MSVIKGGKPITLEVAALDLTSYITAIDWPTSADQTTRPAIGTGALQEYALSVAGVYDPATEALPAWAWQQPPAVNVPISEVQRALASGEVRITQVEVDGGIYTFHYAVAAALYARWRVEYPAVE